MGTPRVVCVTQARMTSTRLPGKVLLPACGRPLLDHHLERLSRAHRVDEVVLATTVNATDDPLLAVAAARGSRVVRGPEDDVLHRYALAAEAAGADIVVRVTSDCPLIDPGLIDLVVETFLEDPSSDYCGLDVGSYPRGLDVEVFRRRDLDAADRDPATVAYEREHVTPTSTADPGASRSRGCPTPDRRWRIAGALTSRRTSTWFGDSWRRCSRKILDSHGETACS